MIEIIAALALQTSAICPENPLPFIPQPEQCRRQETHTTYDENYTVDGDYTGRGRNNPWHYMCNARPWMRVCDVTDGVWDNGCSQYGAPGQLCNGQGTYIFIDSNTNERRACRGGPGYYWCRYGEPWCGTWGQGCS